MHVNLLLLLVSNVAGSRFGSRFGDVPMSGRRGALLSSIAVGSHSRRRVPRVGGSGRSHSPRRVVFSRAGGSGHVLRPSLGIFSSSLGATVLDLGGKGKRGKDGCDCESGFHKWFDEFLL